MNNKLSNFVNTFNKYILPLLNTSDKVSIYYKYISEKTLVITVQGLSTSSLNKIISLKPRIELTLNAIFKVQFGDNKYSKIVIGTNVQIFIVDILKVNYKLYNTLKSNIASNCDNYFCSFQEYKAICLHTKKFTYTELYSEIFNRVRTVDFTSIPNKDLPQSSCKLFYNTLPTKEWVESQIKYLNALDDLSKNILYLYSLTGDKLMNLFLRNAGKMDNNIYNIFVTNFNDNKYVYNALMGNLLYDEKTVASYIRRLIRKLKYIIDNSPLSPNPFYVYRGRTDEFVPTNNYNSDSFLSTSIMTNVALKFSYDKNKLKNGTIIRFKVRSRCLLLSNSKYINEYEILLPFGEKYSLKDSGMSEFLLPDGNRVNVNYVEYGDF